VTEPDHLRQKLGVAIDEISFRAINWRGKFLPSQVISLARRTLVASFQF
jgi:hypothetical protein